MEQLIVNIIKQLKGLYVKLYLQFHGCKVGKNLKCYSIPFFKSIPRRNIFIGDNVTLGRYCTFDITQSGKLIIGNNVQLTHNNFIASLQKVSIGDYTAIAENTSIRDSDHGVNKGELTILQPMNAGEIEIGKDVWIGANCVILKNSKIEDHTIIGANSIVNHKSKIEAYKIYAGSPVKLISERK